MVVVTRCAPTEVQTGYQPIQKTTYRTVEGGAIVESAGAIATIALAIVGLAGVFSLSMAAIATIVLGASMWIEGGAYAASRAGARGQQGLLARTLEYGETVSSEFLGGLAGIILGILALLGVAAVPLVSIAALVLGATFLFSGTGSFFSSNRGMIGLAGIVLGILAVVGLDSLVLVLVALECMGAALMLRGASTGARMAVEAHQ
jgi:hypothetical protein